MRVQMCLVLMLILAISTSATNGREGGETVEDALPIDALPFTDTGETCDNINDYDEACPYTGSTAPDVVYVFSPGEEGVIDIDLCASLYDTKVYVYDLEGGYGFGNPLACNDDAGCGYSGYQSLIEGCSVTAGHTYHIVVDGYGESCGEYELTIDRQEPCVVECPAGAVFEGEPPLVDDYEDTWNGGCSGPEHGYPFQYLCGDENNELTLCGISGYYTYGDSIRRDTDWFVVYKAAEPCDVSVIVEHDSYVGQAYFDPIQRCEGDWGFIWMPVLEPCWEFGPAPFAGDIGDEIWFVILPLGWDTHPLEFDYVLKFRGIEGSHTPTRETTWGAIKHMFK